MPFPIGNEVFEHYWSLCVAGILAVWFAASILHQFRFNWWQLIARFDVFNLLPRWSFFAPNPGRYDIHVVYRCWTATGPGPWMEIDTGKTNRWRWIWNPSRYSSKGICDLVNSLYYTIQANQQHPRAVILSGPYIGILSIVMCQSVAEQKISGRQFAIVSTQGFTGSRTMTIKFISEIHRADN